MKPARTRERTGSDATSKLLQEARRDVTDCDSDISLLQPKYCHSQIRADGLRTIYACMLGGYSSRPLATRDAVLPDPA